MTLSLRSVLFELEQSAPLELAEAWDNVGLLLDGASPEQPCRRLLVTIELTEPVLEEALQSEADLVVAYHPPIFSGLKRLRQDVASERVVLRAVRAGLAVYSPHTALDAVAGGMTDWLAAALGTGQVRAIAPSLTPHQQGFPQGQGRVVELERPLALTDAVAALKTHLGLERVRLAAAPRHAQGELIGRLAVCPGAGGSVFEKVNAVDLLLTGEMRHHDVAARVAQGTSVVLCDHTNSERGFLSHYAQMLRERLTQVDVLVSATDRDPLAIV